MTRRSSVLTPYQRYANDEGRRLEREEIVSYVRRFAEIYGSAEKALLLRMADRIERREHHEHGRNA